MIDGADGVEEGRASLGPAPGRSRRWSDLFPRLLSAVVLIILALLSAALGGGVFAAFWLIAALAVLWEWQRLVSRERFPARFTVGVLTLVAVAVLNTMGDPVLAAVAAALGAMILGAVAVPGTRGLAAGGVVYGFALLGGVLVLRNSWPYGLEAILWLFAVVWGTDIMAYFGGRLVGGPKLWPRFSPSKTWSGFLIGIGSGAVAGLFVRPLETPILPCLLLGLLAGVVAQGGDLLESSLKRRFGVKDASSIIPGHGGAMDRLDGFIAATLFAACVGVARFGFDSAGAGLFNW